MLNDIRIAPNELYAKGMLQQMQPIEESKNDFNQIMNTIPTDKENNSEVKINFSNLGAPAGFFADVSMISSDDANIIGINQI